MNGTTNIKVDTKSIPIHTHTKMDITDFPISLPANGGNSATVNGYTVASNVPSGAKFTDTIYTHPSTHASNIIAQDANNRFVSDAEKNVWNGKANGDHSHAYLSSSGGMLDGSLNFTSNRAISWPGNDSAGIPLFNMTRINTTDGGSRFQIYPRGWNTSEVVEYGIIIGLMNGSSNYRIGPYSNNLYDIGHSTYKFKNIYANNGVIQTSDRETKDNINQFNDEFVKEFIMGLLPVSYTFKDGESGRTHYGLIAQDLEDLMSSLDMGSKDFAGFIKNPKIETEYIPGGEIKTKEIEDKYTYALRYEEFISPLIRMVQIQQKEIDRLKSKLNDIV